VGFFLTFVWVFYSPPSNAHIKYRIAIVRIQNQSWKVGWYYTIIGLVFVLITVPFFKLVPEHLSQGKYGVLAVFVFTLMGIHTMSYGLMALARQRKFSGSYLEIAESQVSLGAEFSGALIIPNTNLRELVRSQFLFTLNNLNERITGSGKNRSRWLSVLWQEKLLKNAEFDGRGLRIPFSFTIPSDCSKTDVSNRSDKIFWKLEAHASLPGLDYFGEFTFEVQKTERTNETLKANSMPATAEMVRNLQPLDLKDTVVKNESGPYKSLQFKTLRARPVNFAFAIFGLVCLAVSLGMAYALVRSSSWFELFFIPFILVFGGVGIFLEVFMLYTMFTARTMNIKATGVFLRKSIFGMKFENEIRWDQIQEIVLKPSSSQGTKVWYDVKLKIKNGPSKTIANQIENKIEAEWIRQQILDANPLKAA
jgi:hypothetical protein